MVTVAVPCDGLPTTAYVSASPSGSEPDSAPAYGVSSVAVIDWPDAVGAVFVNVTVVSAYAPPSVVARTVTVPGVCDDRLVVAYPFASVVAEAELNVAVPEVIENVTGHDGTAALFMSRALAVKLTLYEPLAAAEAGEADTETVVGDDVYVVVPGLMPPSMKSLLI